MDAKSTGIRDAALQLLAVRADVLSRRLTLSERLRPIKRKGLHPSHHRFATAPQEGPVVLRTANSNATAAAGPENTTLEDQFDASYDPRRDQVWSQR